MEVIRNQKGHKELVGAIVNSLFQTSILEAEDLPVLLLDHDSILIHSNIEPLDNLLLSHQLALWLLLPLQPLDVDGLIFC